MTEEFYTATFGNGVQVDHPIDLRKRKAYRFPQGSLTEEEAVEVAKTILVITGTKDIVESSPAKKAPLKNEPKQITSESPATAGKATLPICSSCATVPCPRLDERGTKPINECQHYTKQGGK